MINHEQCCAPKNNPIVRTPLKPQELKIERFKEREYDIEF